MNHGDGILRVVGEYIPFLFIQPRYIQDRGLRDNERLRCISI